MVNAAPGWYPNPSNDGAYAYWDGNRWGEPATSFSPQDQPTNPVLGQDETALAAPPATERRPYGGKIIALGTLAIAAATFGIDWFLGLQYDPNYAATQPSRIFTATLPIAPVAALIFLIGARSLRQRSLLVGRTAVSVLAVLLVVSAVVTSTVLRDRRTIKADVTAFFSDYERVPPPDNYADQFCQVSKRKEKADGNPQSNLRIVPLNASAGDAGQPANSVSRADRSAISVQISEDNLNEERPGYYEVTGTTSPREDEDGSGLCSVMLELELDGWVVRGGRAIMVETNCDSIHLLTGGPVALYPEDCDIETERNEEEIKEVGDVFGAG